MIYIYIHHFIIYCYYLLLTYFDCCTANGIFSISICKKTATTQLPATLGSTFWRLKLVTWQITASIWRTASYFTRRVPVLPVRFCRLWTPICSMHGIFTLNLMVKDKDAIHGSSLKGKWLNGEGIFMKGLMVSLSPVLDKRFHDETAGSLTLWWMVGDVYCPATVWFYFTFYHGIWWLDWHLRGIGFVARSSHRMPSEKCPTWDKLASDGLILGTTML